MLKKSIYFLFFCIVGIFAKVYNYVKISRLVLYISWKSIKHRKKYRYVKHVIFASLILALVFSQIFALGVVDYYKGTTTPTTPILFGRKAVTDQKISNVTTRKNESIILKIPSEREFRMKWIQNKLEKIAKNAKRWDIVNLLNSVPIMAKPSTKVHILYQTTYGNLKVDGDWKLWNLQYNPENTYEYPTSKRALFSPPEDISSHYYPSLGCYSSRDNSVISIHFKQIRDAGIGVAIVSWSPQDFESKKTNDIIKVILNEAELNQVKVAFQIESYSGRSCSSLVKDINQITTEYTSHPAVYKILQNGKYLPVFYMCESYLIPASDWRKLLAPGGSQSIRGTSCDAFFIGLLLDKNHRYDIEKSGFDGFYSYFSSNGYSYGSSWKNWKILQQFAKKRNLLFFPTISPGYIDTKIRPWNVRLTRHRSRGHYYQMAWRSVIAANPLGVSISSFNKWEEGSQIEPAQPKTAPQFTYLDYEPEGPYFYLNLTRYWVSKFIKNK